jgi:uncharacterized protein YjbJ (UPF0337 family)
MRVLAGKRKELSQTITSPVASVKPNSDRRNTMKSGTRDEAEGKWHQVKGKVKEIAGKVIMNPDLEAEGKAESQSGEVQEKVGEIKKVVGK